MRFLAGAIAIFAVAAGCSTPDDPSSKPARGDSTKGGARLASPGTPSPSTNRSPAGAIVLAAGGRIHSINPGLRFVVIDYTLGGVPPLQSLLHVYRSGERVGQVRLSGPERNGFVAGDILEGVLQVDDEVRLE